VEAEDIGIRVVPEDDSVPVTFECVTNKAMEETVAALRAFEGVEVGWCLLVLTTHLPAVVTCNRAAT